MIRVFCLIAAFVILPLEAEETRVPWTTSRVVGLPSPPKPYAAEAFWTHLSFKRGCDIAHLPSQGAIVITEQMGKIWSLPDDLSIKEPEKKLFADFRVSHDPFKFTLSVCFHPKFEENREVFVFYRTVRVDDHPDGVGTRISRFRTYPDRFELDPSTEEVIITFRAGEHNGGHLGFGHDEMLYILSGDGGTPSPPDPLNTGQDTTDLLSSVLRIDVDRCDEGKAYRIPDDNPFLDTPGARPEIWAYGLRNPWKLCFQPDTGDLWVGDVGWELWEMIHRVERGANFGWPIVEGVQPIRPTVDPGPSPISPPMIFHPHTEMASITGGYFYQGDRLPDLKGRYLYGDFVTGQVWGMSLNGRNVAKKEFLADTRLQIVSFGQAAEGEVIFIDWGNDQKLYRLVPNTAEDTSGSFPTTLSETGLFKDLETEEPADGVYGFEIKSPRYHDGATADRWIGLPTTDAFPEWWATGDDTVLAKTISRDGRKLETQVLHYSNKLWQGYSYRWNDEQTDATLVNAAGESATIDGKPWTFHSRTDCMRCHNEPSGYRLAFQPGQLDRDGQLERFRDLGVFGEKFVSRAAEYPVAGVADTTSSIELRARTWLAVNCGQCHRHRGGGSVPIHMNLEQALGEMALVNAIPQKGDFNIENPYLIAPGDPYRSVLYYRSVTPGVGHMPMIGPRTVDHEGVKVLHDWIASLTDESSESSAKSPPEPGLEDISSALRLIHLLHTDAFSAEEASDWIAKGKAAPDLIISGLFQDF